MNWNDPSLKFLALSPTEVAILTALDSVKNLKELASATSLPRTSVAFTIKLLTKKGLLVQSKYGKRLRYIAVSASEFCKTLQQASDVINANGGEKKGARVVASKESEFIIHRGIKEMIPAYERVTSLNRNERLKAIQPNKSWINLHKKLTAEQMIRTNNAMRNNNIIIDAIVQQNAYKLYGKMFRDDPEALKEIAESFMDRSADYVSVPANVFDYNAEIFLFKNTVLINNWAEEISIEITNKDIMNFMKDMYEIVKQSGSKIDHNKAIRDILSSKGNEN